MAGKPIARIGQKTPMPARLRYSRNSAVLAAVGAEVTAAVRGCRWSPAATAYLQSLDVERMNRRAGIRHGRRDEALAGFGLSRVEDLDQQLYRFLRHFPRGTGYLSFARDLRRNLKEAVQAAKLGPSSVLLMARGEGAWGVLHTDGNLLDLAEQRRMLVTLPTAPSVRGTILDVSAQGLPPLFHDGQLYGDAEDPKLRPVLAEVRAGDFGIWNMAGTHKAHAHSEPRVAIKKAHRLGLVAKHAGIRPELLRPKRQAPPASTPRLTIVITPNSAP